MAPLGVERVAFMPLGLRLLARAPPPVMAANPAAVAPQTPRSSRRFIAILLLLRNVVLLTTHPEWAAVLMASLIPLMRTSH